MLISIFRCILDIFKHFIGYTFAFLAVRFMLDTNIRNHYDVFTEFLFKS